MIAALTRFELEILRREPRAWGPLLCLAVLVLLSFASLSLENARSDAAKREVAAAERARWLAQGEKDPHSAAHYSVFAFKPSAPLAALDPGSAPFLGQAVWLEAHHQNDMLGRPMQEASPLQRAGLASPAGLILGTGPLIAFLLAFTVVARDRERGTLRLALGAASDPSRIVRSKTLAIWAALTALLVFPVGLAAAVASAATQVLSADLVLRLALWTALMSGYLGLTAVIGVTVSLRTSGPRLSLALLFGLWAIFAVALPRAASSAADALQPLPSTQSVRQRILHEAPAYWSAEAGARQKKELMARYGVDSLDDIPNVRMAELDLVERRSHQAFDRILGGFYDRVEAQDRLFGVFGLSSPTAAAQALSSTLTGGDFSHHRDFIQKAEHYRRNLVNRMNGDGMAHRVSGAERHTNDIRLWSQIPPFSYAPPRLTAGATAAWTAIPALLLWLFAGWLAFTLTARRLQP